MLFSTKEWNENHFTIFNYNVRNKGIQYDKGIKRRRHNTYFELIGMCRELSAIGTKESQYHLVAFIIKATVWATVLEEGQEITQTTTLTGQGDEMRGQEKGKQNY